MTNSLAILATAADSIMDFMMSLANYFFVSSAAKPPDADHPYGHGKIESLAGLLQSLFMAILALILLAAAVNRFIRPEPIELPMAGVIVMVISIIVNFWHVRNLRRSMLSSGSQIMATEYVHYASDFLIHFGVVATLILYKFTDFQYWDPIMSILVVGYIIYSIYRIFNNSLAELMDEQLPSPILKELQTLIMSFHPNILSYHELRTRKVGDLKFIEFHLELKEITDFKEAHELTENLIAAIKKKHRSAVVTVHTDPEGGI